MKLSVLPEVVEGKRVVVVDDSIVRGTTARRRVTRLREVGAKEVHVRISCPPIRHPCFYGIDFPTRGELIAGQQPHVDSIRDFIEADSLGYLSLEGLFAPFASDACFCRACFTGKYPTNTDNICAKSDLERSATELNLHL
jgi:amidophosphoribosyltransferase